eukprot:5618102-Alexandrium_andersonii.AAC.1
MRSRVDACGPRAHATCYRGGALSAVSCAPSPGAYRPRTPLKAPPAQGAEGAFRGGFVGGGSSLLERERREPVKAC